MARVTVEDCLEKFNNRFELIMESSKRARQLMKGAEARVDWENDKSTVVALREIADGHVGVADELEEQAQLEEKQMEEAGQSQSQSSQQNPDPNDYFKD